MRGSHIKVCMYVINIPVTEEAAITACVTCGCSELTKPGKEKFGQQHQPAVKEAEETEKRERLILSERCEHKVTVCRI